MTKRFRMLIALFTALSMLFAFGLSAMAASFPDVDEDDEYYSAAELLAELDIYRGYPDGSFGAENPITRAEFAAIVVRMLNREAAANALADLPTGFTDDADIDSWARGYINYAVNQGIIQGYPDGTFKPNGNVTFAEAYAMLIRALGLDKAAKGSWPANYIGLAAEIGLSDGLDGAANVPITRGEMAIAAENGLFTSYEWDSDNEELVEHADGSASLLVKRHGWSEDDWADRNVTVASGELIAWRSGNRVQVGNNTYTHIGFDAQDGVELRVNGGEIFRPNNINKAKAWIEEDKDYIVTLTFNSKNQVTRISATKETHKNALLVDIDADDDVLSIEVHTDGGTNVTPHNNLTITGDTIFNLNGKRATAEEVEEALEDLRDEYGNDANAVARVWREVNNDDGDPEVGNVVYRIDVVTDNIVSGKIERRGTSGGDRYVQINGERIIYDRDYLDIAPNRVDTEITLLLGIDGKARVELEGTAKVKVYYAELLDVAFYDDDEFEIEVKLADGSSVIFDESNFTFANDDERDDFLEELEQKTGTPVLVNENNSKNVEIKPYDHLDAPEPEEEGNVDRIRENDIRVDGRTFVFAEIGVLVYDAEENEFIDLDDIRTNDEVQVYVDDKGEVGLIVINF